MELVHGDRNERRKSGSRIRNKRVQYRTLEGAM